MKKVAILILTLAAIGHGISALSQSTVEDATLNTVDLTRAELSQ